MKVVDAHVHVQPWRMLHPDILAAVAGSLEPGTGEILSDRDALLRHLDESDVETAWCINEVATHVMGFTPEVNAWITRFTEGHRDRLVPVGSVDPTQERDVRGELRRILDLGIRVLKLHPPHQYFRVNAYREALPRLAFVYEECEERGVPIIIHTGTSVFPRARNIYADPMPVDDIAIDFPRLRIILAHAGRPLYADTALFLLRRHPNVYADLSGIPPRRLLEYLPRIEDVADKLLWGTDWPSPGVRSMRQNLDDFRALGLGDEVQRRVLRENAIALLT